MAQPEHHPAVAASVFLRGGVHIAVVKLGRRGCAIYTDHERKTPPARATAS